VPIAFSVRFCLVFDAYDAENLSVNRPAAWLR